CLPTALGDQFWCVTPLVLQYSTQLHSLASRSCLGAGQSPTYHNRYRFPYHVLTQLALSPPSVHYHRSIPASHSNQALSLVRYLKSSARLWVRSARKSLFQ